MSGVPRWCQPKSSPVFNLDCCILPAPKLPSPVCRYYFIHRWFHSRKAVFRVFHALHHSPAGNLNTNSASYVDLLGGLLEGGVPMAALYAATCAVSGNFWVFFAGLTTMSAHVLNGHAGCSILVDHPAELGWLAAWPMMAMQLSTPFRMTAQDHESHHKDPRCVCDQFRQAAAGSRQRVASGLGVDCGVFAWMIAVCVCVFVWVPAAGLVCCLQASRLCNDGITSQPHST